MAGQITAEQLTKFILYSEWLIYSTWFVGDNLSSLMQSVGASEKVFQMMDLAPSHQFTSKGKQLVYRLKTHLKFMTDHAYLLLAGSKLPNLKGHIDFVNVSFRYSSRETVRFYFVSYHKHWLISLPREIVEVAKWVGQAGWDMSKWVILCAGLNRPNQDPTLLNCTDIKLLLKCKEITPITFQQVHVLQDISISVNPYEVVALVSKPIILDS